MKNKIWLVTIYNEDDYGACSWGNEFKKVAYTKNFSKEDIKKSTKEYILKYNEKAHYPVLYKEPTIEQIELR